MNGLLKKQAELDEYWKTRLSDPEIGKIIESERRWSYWVSIKRDAIIEVGFSREEAMQLIVAQISKPEFHQKLVSSGQQDDD